MTDEMRDQNGIVLVQEKSSIPFKAWFTGGLVSIFVTLLVMALLFWLVGFGAPIIASPFFGCFAGVLVIRAFCPISNANAGAISVAYIVAPTFWLVAYGIDAIVVLLTCYFLTIPLGIVGGILAAAISAPPTDPTIEKGNHVTTK